MASKLLELSSRSARSLLYSSQIELTDTGVGMFLVERLLKKNGITYLYLMESVYDPVTRKSKPKIVNSFGNRDTFIKEYPEKYAELKKLYGSSKEKYKAEKERTINGIFKDLGGNLSDSKFLENFKAVLPQNYAHLALRNFWNVELQMSKFLDYLKSYEGLEYQYDLSEIALYFTVLKIISPCSYREGMDLSPSFLGDPMAGFKKDDIYRSLHLLADYKDRIIKHVSDRVDSIVQRGKTLLFYDCTNCYFETPCNDTYWFKKKAQRLLRRRLRKEHPDFKTIPDKELDRIIDENESLYSELEEIIESFGEPLRMHGVSKEKRTDLPLVSIALVIDEFAIPIDFQVFSGNKAETGTMAKSVRALKEKYKIQEAIIVADSALNGTKNLSMLLDEGFGFSVAKSALSFSRDIRENELDLKDFAPVKDQAGNDTSFLYKVIPYHQACSDRKEKDKDGKNKKYSIDCNLMITFSESRKSRDLELLEENLRRAQQAIERKENVKLLSGGWKQFVYTESPEDAKNRTDRSESSKEIKKEDYIKVSDQQCDKDAKVESPKDSNKGSETVSQEELTPSLADSTENDKKKSAPDNPVLPTQDKDKSNTQRVRPKTYIAVALNEELIKKRKRCAGYAGILYQKPNGSNIELTPSYVSTLYHHLVQIEDCFRVMKSDFDIRPLFVRDRKSVTGHILLCVLALIIVRVIQHKFAEQNLSVTISDIQTALNELKLMTLFKDERNCVYLKALGTLKRDSMRKDSETNDDNEDSISDRLFGILAGTAIPSISTIEQLRDMFQLKTLRRSEFQLSKLRAKCSSQAS